MPLGFQLVGICGGVHRLGFQPVGKYGVHMEGVWGANWCLYNIGVHQESLEFILVSLDLY